MAGEGYQTSGVPMEGSASALEVPQVGLLVVRINKNCRRGQHGMCVEKNLFSAFGLRRHYDKIASPSVDMRPLEFLWRARAGLLLFRRSGSI